MAVDAFDLTLLLWKHARRHQTTFIADRDILLNLKSRVGNRRSKSKLVALPVTTGDFDPF